MKNYRFTDENDRYAYVEDEQIERLLNTRLHDINLDLVIENDVYTVWTMTEREYETTDLTELVYKVDELEQRYAAWKNNSYELEDDYIF